jgi:hypothetical protein
MQVNRRGFLKLFGLGGIATFAEYKLGLVNVLLDVDETQAVDDFVLDNEFYLSNYSLHYKGDAIECVGKFTDADTGIHIDPAVVTCQVLGPDGIIDSHIYGIDERVVRASEGCYSYAFVLREAGVWFYRWLGSGPDCEQIGNRIYVLPNGRLDIY